MYMHIYSRHALVSEPMEEELLEEPRAPPVARARVEPRLPAWVAPDLRGPVA